MVCCDIKNLKGDKFSQGEQKLTNELYKYKYSC